MTASRTPRPFTAVLAAGGAALALLAGVTLGSVGVPSGWSLSPRDAHAQDTQVPESAGITIIGDAVVKAKPDTTTLRLGVDATAQTPAAALSQTRDTTERVLQRLRERGVPEADLQTSGLNVFRVQEGRDGPGAPTPAATAVYRGHASISAQVADPNRAGALLDAAMQAGATSVEGLSFGLRDDSALRRQALTAAIEDARPKAEAAAAAAGLRLGGVRSVLEIPVGPPKGGDGMGGGAAEGVAPGELTVQARVQVTYEVAR